MTIKRKVLFICSANSARSQMAEALLRAMASEHFDVYSAGTQPAGIRSEALLALQELDVDTAGLRSKSLTEFNGKEFDFIITLCDKARQECQTLPNAGEYLAWDVEDPHNLSLPMPYLRVAKAIRERLKLFVLVNTKSI